MTKRGVGEKQGAGSREQGRRVFPSAPDSLPLCLFSMPNNYFVFLILFN